MRVGESKKGLLIRGCFMGLFLLALLILAAPPAAAFNNPHGPFSALPVECAACHVTHYAPGPGIMKTSYITALCLTCHDGTGSNYNTATHFSSGGGSTYFHPVKNTGNPAVGETIECINCHNPHGDINPGTGANYPRLLNSTDGTGTYYQGPNFCLGCHGNMDRNFSGPGDLYWENTLGSHTNSNSPAHYNSAQGVLQPASGTLVTCAKCHDKHGAQRDSLLLGTSGQAEETQCRVCHNSHAVDRFDLAGSVHNLDGSGGSRLECTSCHGPHSVNSENTLCQKCHYPRPNDYNAYKLEETGTISILSDPDNTKAIFVGTGQGGTGLGGTPNSEGNMNDFCLRCHDGYPPQAVANTTTVVPYSIIFPTLGFTTNSAGWNKAGYLSSGHATNPTMAIKCNKCHDGHGSNRASLLWFVEDTSTASGECLSCHDGSQTTAGAANVKADLTKASRHPALYVNGKHNNTESHDGMAPANRHAECADCHNPHQNTGVVTSAPVRSGAIAGVSGVVVSWGTSSWTNWPGDAAFQSTLDLATPRNITFQYELCLKCHSYYSFGASPPAAPSGGNETDQAREFNPNNPAYHAVVDESKVATFTYNSQTYYYGKYVSPWTATSRVYCTDCHASESSGVKGAHGSINPYILLAPWDPNTGSEGKLGTGTTGTSGDLCFKCHDFNFYTGGTGSSGSATVRSKFSQGTTYNRHSKHKGRGCASCHGAVPHGWPQRTDPSDNVTTNGAVAEWNLGDPYQTGSWLDVNTWRSPGAWTENDCNHSNLPAGGNPNSGSACG